MLHLEKTDYKNIRDIIGLKVSWGTEEHRGRHNISIAQTYSVQGTDTFAFPFGFYYGKWPVGLLMISFDKAGTYDAFDEEPPKNL